MYVLLCFNPLPAMLVGMLTDFKITCDIGQFLHIYLQWPTINVLGR